MFNFVLRTHNRVQIIVSDAVLRLSAILIDMGLMRTSLGSTWAEIGRIRIEFAPKGASYGGG